MNTIFASEKLRIVTNYLNLLAGLVIGFFLTRALLTTGNEVFSVYFTITIGIGISIMLSEMLRMGIVPNLGAYVRGGTVQEVEKFQTNLCAAFLVSLFSAILGAFFMLGIGYYMLAGLISEDLKYGAWVFLIFRILTMLVVVTVTPVMCIFLVSSRQPIYNLFLFFERLSEYAGIIIPLILLSMKDYTDGDRLVQFGFCISVMTCLTYFCAVLVAFSTKSTRIRIGKNLGKDILTIIRSTGWSSLQTLSMNLYVRADILFVASFLGPQSVVAFSIAARLTGYVRQATIGLVNGIDATFANLKGLRRSSSQNEGNAEEAQAKILWYSTALQGAVIFHTIAFLMIFRHELIIFWIGDVLEASSKAKIVAETAQLVCLMVIGMGLRSLNLGWMSAMTGLGLAKYFTPWLLPGAVGNALTILVWVTYFPDTFSVFVVGTSFLFFQTITHVLIVPRLTAKHLAMDLKPLISPLVIPFSISVLVYFGAYSLMMISDFETEIMRIIVVSFLFVITFLLSNGLSIYKFKRIWY